MQKKKKNRRRVFWGGWRKDAMNRFSVSASTVLRRFNNAEPNLIEWLNIEMENRKEARKTRDKLIESVNNA